MGLCMSEYAHTPQKHHMGVLSLLGKVSQVGSLKNALCFKFDDEILLK
jgi:hypothetical protein